jgi:hypothetical protein
MKLDLSNNAFVMESEITQADKNSAQKRNDFRIIGTRFCGLSSFTLFILTFRRSVEEQENDECPKCHARCDEEDFSPLNKESEFA